MAGKAKSKRGFGKKLKDQQVTNKELYNISGAVPTQASNSIVTSGSQGGGTYLNAQGADIFMNTYDIVDVDRLKFATKEGAGDILTNTDYGMEALYFPDGAVYGIGFRIPDAKQYIFWRGDDILFSINSDYTLIGQPLSVYGYEDMFKQDSTTIGNPSPSYRRIFVDEDNSDHLSVKDSSGNVVDLEAGDTGANITLSNLTDPTTINANLEPDYTAGHANERDLGHDDKIWAKAYIKDIYNTGLIKTETSDHEMQFYTGGSQRLAISDNSSNGAGYSELFGVIAGSGETQTHPSYKTVATDVSPADNDMVGALGFDGYNSATERLTWARMVGVSDVVTDSAETAHFELKALQSGTEKTMLETDQFGIYLSNDTSGGSSPAYNGAIYRDGNDIKCYTGGTTKNLSDIGTGGSSGANTALSNLDTTTALNATLRPTSHNAYDLGTSTREWRNLYVDGIGYIDIISGISASITTVNATNLYASGVAQFTGANTTLGNSATDQINIYGILDFQHNTGSTGATSAGTYNGNITSPDGYITVEIGGTEKTIPYYST